SAIGERSPRPYHCERQHGDNHQQAATPAGGLGLFVIVVLIGVGIIRIGGLTLIVLRAFELAIERIVIARRICLSRGLLIGRFVVAIILVLRGRLLRGVALQRMHRARIILLHGNAALDVALRHGAGIRTLHPGRRTGRRLLFLDRLLVLLVLRLVMLRLFV